MRRNRRAALGGLLLMLTLVFSGSTFAASNAHDKTAACKNDGWKTAERADHSTFKNQGDCIQYFNTGK